jgi:diketogulonate reductase-like aldo/keto reductase
METGGSELPTFVQNHCYARLGWDRGVRQFCREHKIVYQGFSLLTANQEVWNHALVGEIAALVKGTRAQVVFSFARSIGILPLTGTTEAEHMMEDLASLEIVLPLDAVEVIESLAG